MKWSGCYEMGRADDECVGVDEVMCLGGEGGGYFTKFSETWFSTAHNKKS